MDNLLFETVSCGLPDFRDAIRRHYTQSRGAPPGKKQAWRITFGGVVLGWVGAGEPAYKLAPRRRLGLNDARPAEHTVSNFILRLERSCGPRASDIIKAWLPVLKRDWCSRYGWEPLHIETLVDPECVGDGDTHVAGYSFRRAGFRSLGFTTGRTARRPEGHTRLDTPRVWSDSSPKLLLYYGPLPRVHLATATEQRT